MKIVNVKREISGSANINAPTVYSCEGWEVSIRRGHLNPTVVSVKSPEGDPDNEVVAEMIGAILKDQVR